MKFKVGDKVRIRKDLKCGEKYGGVRATSEMVKLKGTVRVIAEAFILDAYKVKDNTGCSTNPFIWASEMLEPVNETIVIYRKGAEVIALDKFTGKKAVAKCNPADKFDFSIGAKLAFERLTAPETVVEVDLPEVKSITITRDELATYMYSLRNLTIDRNSTQAVYSTAALIKATLEYLFDK